jgi:hypothetical protein
MVGADVGADVGAGAALKSTVVVDTELSTCDVTCSTALLLVPSVSCALLHAAPDVYGLPFMVIVAEPELGTAVSVIDVTV